MILKHQCGDFNKKFDYFNNTSVMISIKYSVTVSELT